TTSPFPGDDMPFGKPPPKKTLDQPGQVPPVPVNDPPAKPCKDGWPWGPHHGPHRRSGSGLGSLTHDPAANTGMHFGHHKVPSPRAGNKAGMTAAFAHVDIDVTQG